MLTQHDIRHLKPTDSQYKRGCGNGLYVVISNKFVGKDGKKYGKDGKILPQEKDWATSEKAKAAKIHKEYRDRVTKDAKYISMRKMWREYENHNLQEIQ